MYSDDIQKGYGQMFDLAGQGIQAVGGWMQHAAQQANGGPTVEMTPQQRALYERRYGKQPPVQKTPPKTKPKGERNLPENRYRDSERTGITRFGGKTYDLSIPHHRDLYNAAIKDNRTKMGDPKTHDLRGGSGIKPDGGGDFDPPPRPSPYVPVQQQQGRTSGKLSSAGFAEANDLLKNLGIDSVQYGGFASTNLPVSGDKPQGGSDRAAFGGTDEEDRIIQGGGSIETVIDGKQTEGSPKLTQSGGQQVTSRVETAPLGSQRRYGAEFMADRPNMRAQDSTSLVGLRAAEASKGLLYASGKYWKANPNAGQEGQKDFVEIKKDEWNTIKRGDQHASQYKPPAASIADMDTTTDTWKQSGQDFKNDYVGMVQQSMKGSDPKMGYIIADEAKPMSKIDGTAAVTQNVPRNAPNLISAVDVRFTDKDATGRYNNFNNR